MTFKLNKLKTSLTFPIFVVVIAVLSLSCSRGSQHKDFDRFKDSAGKLLQKTAALAKKARKFDQAKALKSLNKLPINGFYYRFDDRIARARVDGGQAKEAGNPHLVNFEFDGKDTPTLQSANETHSIAAGILKIKHAPDAYFDTAINLPANRLGRIEIRAKHRKGKLMRLGINRNIKNYATWRDHFLDHFNVIPDNTFHVYTIDAKQLRKSRISGTAVIKNFYLFASDRKGDDVEIDYIRIVSRKANYLREPFGSAYETKKAETRKVLYSQTPLSLTYDVKIPPGAESVLRFGMGVIDDTDPVTFTLLTGNKKEIFSRRVTSAAGWEDTRISMKPYAGKKITLTFKSESRKGNIALWSNPILYRPPQKRFNIIVILEDALRSGSMSCYGYNRDTTPVKKAFAENGVLFENAFSQAPNTRPSCASLMTSLYPTTTKLYLLENYLTAAEILRYSGFRTAAFIQNPNSGNFAGLHQGFSDLYSQFKRRATSEDIYGKDALQWIKEKGDMNFFMYLHLVDPHAPYNPPEEFRRRYNEAKPGKEDVPRKQRLDPPWVTQPTMQGRKARYEGEIENNDFHFETFLDGLEELDILDSTLLVFIADHGEFLGEHGLWTHKPPCYTQVIKTPMIMVYPGKLPRNRIVKQPVQNLDILPTILDLTGLKRDKLLIAGDSLLPLIAREEPDYWNNRIILSNETPNISGDKIQSRFASLIFKHRHIINSSKVPMRRFDYLRDKDELNGTSITGERKEFYESFIRKLYKNNILIWKAITKKKTRRVKYDQKTLKTLRTLGYVD